MRQCGRLWAVGAAVLVILGDARAEKRATSKPEFVNTLTEGPPARALYAGQVRLPVLLEQLSKRSGETVTARDFTAFGFLESADLSRPVLLGTSVSSADTWLAFSPRSPPRTSSPSAAQSAHGLLPIPDTSCAVARVQAGLLELCGSPAAITASSTDILARYAQGNAQHDLEAEVSLRDPKRGQSVYQLRSSVPDFVSSLSALTPKLADDPATVYALSDLAFDWAYGVAETYEQTGPVRWTLDFAADGSARNEFSVRPRKSTRLARAIAGGRNQPPPNFFWQLPSSVQIGFYTSTGTWRPFLTPSARSLELLARVATLPAATDAPALLLAATAFQSCLATDHAVVFGVGGVEKPPAPVRAKSGEPAPAKHGNVGKKAKPGSRKTTAPYMLIGIEDAKGDCGRALQTLFHSAEHATRGATDQRGFSVEPAKLPANFPKPASVLSLIEDQQTSELALSVGKGIVWLSWANELGQLRELVNAELRPNARDVERSMRRPELGELTTTPALLGGFVDIPRILRQTPYGSAQGERADWPLVPILAISRGDELVSTGKIVPRVVSELLAQFATGLTSSDPVASASAEVYASHRRILSVACKLGSDTACNHLGLLFTDGKGTPVDYDSARPLFKTACDHDYGISCGNLGYVEKTTHPDAARTYFDKGCSLESGFSCLAYGTFLIDTGKPGDLALALEQNRKACDYRVAGGCANLGYQYIEGKGTAVDAEKGVELSNQACELGSATGCTWVGNAMMSGKGHVQDEPLGLKYYARACELEQAVGCYLLGTSYLNGRGTDKNLAKAREYLGAACDAGQADACRDLAGLVEGAP